MMQYSTVPTTAETPTAFGEEKRGLMYPPVPKMLESVNNRYLLVNVIARRARQIAIEAEEFHTPLEQKPVTLAIDEIADGKLTATIKEEYLD